MYYEKRIEMVYVNSLKANPGKFQFMILSDKTCYKHILKINSTCVQSSDDVTFQKHTDNLVRKAQYELHALWRIRKCLTIEKAKILANAFIDSQFNYAPSIWMICRKTLYSKIEKSGYGIDDSYNLLFSSNSVSIH